MHIALAIRLILWLQYNLTNQEDITMYKLTFLVETIDRHGRTIHEVLTVVGTIYECINLIENPNSGMVYYTLEDC